MEAARVRAWWWHRQGLDGSLEGAPPGKVLEHAGWARSVGGVSPYLTLFSRAGTSREAADKATANLEIHELPSARGCTYFVPFSDFALALTVGQGFRKTETSVAYKLGVTDKEIDRLCTAVVDALAQGPLDPDGIREATGGASRRLGEEGKKKGLATTLPLALGKLQELGEIRRVPRDGRLDHQRYSYTLWRPNPLAFSKLSRQEALTALARRYFKWIGPASMAEFRWFSGLGVNDSKHAVAPLDLIPLEQGDDRLLFPDDRERMLGFQLPAEPQYALVGSMDSLTLLRRDVKKLLEEPDQERKFFKAGPGPALTDMPSHGIFDRGRLIGLWEYELSTQRIVWCSFVPGNEGLLKAVATTEAFVREQLGDARAMSLDNAKARAPRIDAIMAAAGCA